MRRCKNKKALAMAITLALTVGATGNVFAADAIEYEDGASHEVDLSNHSVTGDGSDNWDALYSGESGTVISSTGGDVNISYTYNGATDAMDSAVLALYDGKINLGSDTTENVTVSAETTNSGAAYALRTHTSGIIGVNGKNINISAKAVNGENAAAVLSGDKTDAGGTITLGSSNTENITLTATNGANWAQGIEALNEGQVTVNGENLTINATNTNGAAAGIMAQNNYDAVYDKDNAASVTVNAQNTTINASGNGGGAIVAYSGSTVTVNNNLTATGSNAIQTRGKSTININPNKDENATVVLNGDIDYNSGETASNSGKTAAAKVNINLMNGQSQLNGNSKVTGYSSDNDNDAGASRNRDDELQLNITAANGGTWNSTDDSFVNTLNVENGGVVNNTGGTLTVLDDLNASGNGSSITANNLQIGETAKDGNNVPAAANIGEGVSLNVQDTLTVKQNSKLTSASGSTVTAGTLDIGENATANLQGVTNINNSLTSTSTSTVNITDLNLASGATSNLQGVTNLSPTTLSSDNPITLNAANLNVNPSNIQVTSSNGLSAGNTTSVRLVNNTSETGTTTLVNNTPKNLAFGTTLQGTGEAKIVNGNDVDYNISVSSEAQPQTHSAVMAQTAGLTTVAGGADYIARAARTMTDQGLNTFAAVGGGENRYDTGSHITTNDWHAVAGVGVKNDRPDGSSTEYGVFYDYGNGRYRTYQSAGYGSGKAIYKGGGLFGKHTFNNNLYVEGSFRAGKVDNTANNIFHDAYGNGYRFKTNSTYDAFHLGVGKIYDLNETDSLDAYVKYFYTHVGSDSFDAGGHYNIDGVDSDILRIGTRWNHKQGLWNYYAGLAYEYEFDGEADGTADGAHIKSSDIGGSSGRFELGTNVDLGKWTLGSNVTAYAGQHRGVSGNITAALRF